MSFMKTDIRHFLIQIVWGVGLGLSSSSILAATFTDTNWISMGGIPGTDGEVYAAVVDGAGNLYIGGNFTVAGGVIANNIAKWDGNSWSAIGSGISGPPGWPISDGRVLALAVSGTDLYVGGTFTNAGGNAVNNIAKWNGTNWSALGSGVSGPPDDPYYGGTVLSLAVSGTDLYVGGIFTNAGGGEANYIAKWDGGSWSAVGSGMNNQVHALAVSGSDLYAGGDFTTAGGTAANYIAKWDGSSWSALGSGLGGTGSYPGIPNALAVSGTDLYVGGQFTTAGGNAASNIAKWDGNNWLALGSGIDLGGWVLALAVSGSNVYVGGAFTTAGGNAASNIAKWDGSNWTALGSGMGGVPGNMAQVLALVVSGSDLYAGGFFTTAGGSTANYIAKWDASSWSALGSGMGGHYASVAALAVSGGDLYTGGNFTTAGGFPASYLAKWNGSNWSALGAGIQGPVSALVVSGTNLSAAHGSAVFQWNGSVWTNLNSGPAGGFGGSVYALAVSGSNLYAGGAFTTVGGHLVNHIAKWNGSVWTSLGSGLGGNAVYALVAGPYPYVYAGGAFTNAGLNNADGLARWDGGSWSALGFPRGSAVYALAASGSDVYAGGYFNWAGATNIIKLGQNGGSSSPLGSGMDAGILALAVSGSNVYAGGSFTTAGGASASRIAKWDGNSWSPLGSGMNGNVLALTVAGSDLYAGGYFTTAGGKASAYVARAIINPPVLAIEPDGFGGYFLSFEGVPGSAYRLQRAPTLNGPWATSSPQTAPASGSLEFWDVFPPPGQGFYRSVGP
jgi:hypothetical protein